MKDAFYRFWLGQISEESGPKVELSLGFSEPKEGRLHPLLLYGTTSSILSTPRFDLSVDLQAQPPTHLFER